MREQTKMNLTYLACKAVKVFERVRMEFSVENLRRLQCWSTKAADQPRDLNTAKYTDVVSNTTIHFIETQLHISIQR